MEKEISVVKLIFFFKNPISYWPYVLKTEPSELHELQECKLDLHQHKWIKKTVLRTGASLVKSLKTLLISFPGLFLWSKGDN